MMCHTNRPLMLQKCGATAMLLLQHYDQLVSHNYSSLQGHGDGGRAQWHIQRRA
jgi:hypothetical protein